MTVRCRRGKLKQKEGIELRYKAKEKRQKHEMSRHKQLTSKLFDNSDSEEECGFSTNKGYAKHYDEFRKKEILSHREYYSKYFFI